MHLCQMLFVWFRNWESTVDWCCQCVECWAGYPRRLQCSCWAHKHHQRWKTLWSKCPAVQVTICPLYNRLVFIFTHSGYIHFSGFLGQKSYFFWLLESRSNPATDPLVVWLTGGPGVNSSCLMEEQYSIMQDVHPKWLCWLKMGLAGPMSMEMEQFQMSSPGQTKQMWSG